MVHVAEVLECVMMMKSKHNLNLQANYGAMFLCPSPATPPPAPQKLQQKLGDLVLVNTKSAHFTVNHYKLVIINAQNNIKF
jgi:hypothetical protein